MRAIRVADDSDHSLLWEEVPELTPGPGEVLLRVRAAGLNRLDLLQRVGAYPVPPGESLVLGVEAAGEIAALGAGVAGWSVGDRACALLGGGGYASHAAVPAGMLLPVPPALSLEEAAALPEVLYTAFVNLVGEAQLRAGESVLIHAGASGVGTAAIQLCNALGARAFATASAPKLERLRELGAAGVRDRASGDFTRWALEVTGGRGMDVILDPVGGPYLHANARSLAPFGRLVVIGLLGGSSGELPVATLLANRLRIVGSLLRARPRAEKLEITAALRAEIWPLVKRGAIRPIVEAVLPIERAAEAHARLRAGDTFGKVVLRID